MQADIAAGGESRNQPHSVPGAANERNDELTSEDSLRAQIYGLLSCVLAQPMSDETLEIVRGFSAVDDDTELGVAMKAFGDAAVRTPRGQAEDEYSALFYGMGAGGELHPYSSYYLTGFIYEKPLAELRKDLADMGIQSANLTGEPEDHVAFLCEIMHGLIAGAWGDAIPLDRQKTFFERHVATWMAKFFEDLEEAESASLYVPVGTIGKLFIAIESEAFGMMAD